MQTPEEHKKYMHRYYMANRETYRRRYEKWCEDNPRTSRSKRGVSKTPKEIEEYRHRYYLANIEKSRKSNKKFVKANPEIVKKHAKKFHAEHPHYERDVRRARVATVEPLIFQFVEGSVGGDMDDYVEYLRDQGTPEQHIRWFKVDVHRYIEVA